MHGQRNKKFKLLLLQVSILFNKSVYTVFPMFTGMTLVITYVTMLSEIIWFRTQTRTGYYYNSNDNISDSIKYKFEYFATIRL